MNPSIAADERRHRPVRRARVRAADRLDPDPPCPTGSPTCRRSTPSDVAGPAPSRSTASRSTATRWHGPHRRDRHRRHDRAWDRREHEPDAAQLPRARRAVPLARSTVATAARARRLEGHDLRAPRDALRLVLRFEDYADPDTPYMYHCHLLWHEDQGMMGQFAVVEPGQQATLPNTEEPAIRLNRPSTRPGLVPAAS